MKHKKIFSLGRHFAAVCGRNQSQFCVTFSRKHERLFPISIIFALFFNRIGI